MSTKLIITIFEGFTFVFSIFCKYLSATNDKLQKNFCRIFMQKSPHIITGGEKERSMFRYRFIARCFQVLLQWSNYYQAKM